MTLYSARPKLLSAVPVSALFPFFNLTKPKNLCTFEDEEVVNPVRRIHIKSPNPAPGPSNHASFLHPRPTTDSLMP